MDVADVLNDLVAEQGALDAVVAQLSDDQWAFPTPSPRWSVADQIGHLTYFDNNAALAITDADAFKLTMAALLDASARGDDTTDDFTFGPIRRMSPSEILEVWREGRAALTAAAASLTNDTRIEWYGPSMGAKSFLTARLMEIWAHGQDVCDTVEAEREPTDRLRHIAQLGYITRGWTYVNRQMDIPPGDVRLDLTAPSGAVWSWGDADDAQVSGPALDFCLVVTQRRNVHDTGLTVVGERAVEWLSMAQAFAGPATEIRASGVR